MIRSYAFNGLAGCVTQTKSRQTGLLVGVYHGKQSGIDDEPTCPWVTLCETHANLCSHPSLKLALSHASDPAGWCEDCRDLLSKRALLAETPADCVNCRRTSHVTALDRSGGRWTCYNCGRITPIGPRTDARAA